jgi:hypothetical protein
MKSRERGFSLLEVAVVAVVTLSALAVSIDFAEASGSALRSRLGDSVLTADANRLVDQVVQELERAGLSTLQLDDSDGNMAISYRRCNGYENHGQLWSPPLRIELVREANSLVWVRDPGLASEQRVVWATGIRPLLEGEIDNDADDNGNGVVDEPGVLFRLENDVLTITASLEGRDQDNRPLVRSAEATIRLRN